VVQEPPAAVVALDLTLPTAEENLALDEALLNEAEEAVRRGEPVRELLRYWESPVPFIVLGSTGRLAEEVHLEACHASGTSILRRSSGGGTVLVGPGCLCFSLILSLEGRPELLDIHGSYRSILMRIAAWLDVAGLEHRGISDLALDDRKISGNAQRRKSRTLLHHGTILYDFDLAPMGRFLKQPVRQPEYRAERSHISFMANLPLTLVAIKQRLGRCWNGRVDEPVNLPDLEPLIQEKYGSPAWTARF
jgi:lipoate-protein ligase A